MKKAIRKRTRTVFICAFCLLTIVLPMTGCTDRGRENHVEEHGTMDIDFVENGMIRNGTAYETYQVEEGQKGIISIGISGKSGKLDLDIYPSERKDDPDYTGRDLDSASFDVILDEPGEYKVCITAKAFVGDYEISWRTEDNPGK